MWKKFNEFLDGCFYTLFAILAFYLSWVRNSSVLWAIPHGFLSVLYVLSMFVMDPTPLQRAKAANDVIVDEYLRGETDEEFLHDVRKEIRKVDMNEDPKRFVSNAVAVLEPYEKLFDAAKEQNLKSALKEAAAMRINTEALPIHGAIYDVLAKLSDDMAKGYAEGAIGKMEELKKDMDRHLENAKTADRLAQKTRDAIKKLVDIQESKSAFLGAF